MKKLKKTLTRRELEIILAAYGFRLVVDKMWTLKAGDWVRWFVATDGSCRIYIGSVHRGDRPNFYLMSERFVGAMIELREGEE